MQSLEEGLTDAFATSGIPATIHRVGSLVGLFLTASPVRDFEGALGTNRSLYARLFHGLLGMGIYFPPSPMEAIFISAAHTAEDVDRTIEAVRRVGASLDGP